MAHTRDQISKTDCWNVEAMFPTFDEWQSTFDQTFPANQKPRWPEIGQYQGKLNTNPTTLKLAIEAILKAEQKIDLLYTYAHLRHDEDIANDKHKSAYQKILGIVHEFAQEMAWFEPELLALPQQKLETYLSAPELTPYQFYIEKKIRTKSHILDKDSEMLLALAGKALDTPSKAFSALNDADFNFGTALDSKGEIKPISHASYALLIRSRDRILRENAFKQYHGVFGSHENTLAELLNGKVQAHLFSARARKYSSCLDAALFPKNIDLQVYRSLIDTVHDNIDALHHYVELRKKVLGVKELHQYDMYVPLTEEVDMTYTYAEAEDLVIESVAPLGREYQEIIRRGFKEERWVDRYENKNKRSGAYSSGCYGSMPYILMNFKEVMRDVFTLAHEAGHSMHSYLSHKNQPYQYSHYPIFLAEVASTFNEDLLTRLLLKRTTDRQEKIFLINQKIEDVRATLFRQTMFAEFELWIHEQAENNIPLTPTLLKEAYHNLNARYFGTQAVIDPEIDIEWARIPHFYYNFYVYQYATGISAALALSERVVSGGDAEREAYLSFLKGGCSRYPIDLLKMAGVDMTKPDPIMSAIQRFRGWVRELEDLLEVDNLALK